VPVRMANLANHGAEDDLRMIPAAPAEGSAFHAIPAHHPAGKRFIRRRVVAWLMPLILALPSLWFRSAVPPLWRDADGYIQVTDKPGVMTILQYAPLYCALSRVPLLAGWKWQGEHEGKKRRTVWKFLRKPILTDHGVHALLFVQHVSLWIALIALICAASRLGSVRLFLAVVCALNAPLYAFAHCVGSEALSIVCTLLLVACTLRLVRTAAPRALEWAAYGGLLIACILTRHVNAVLAGLLPGVLLLRLVGALVARRGEILPRARLFAVSVAAGVAALAASNLALRAACAGAGIPYRARAGYSFTWRLHFLATMPPRARISLMDRLAARTSDPLLKATARGFATATPAPGEYMPAVARRVMTKQLDLPDTGRSDLSLQLDLLRNDFMKLMLRSGEPAFYGSVWADYLRTWRETPCNLAAAPFGTTTYYFTQPLPPTMAGLNTYRGRTLESVMEPTVRSPYLRLLSGFTNRTAAGAAVALALLGAAASRRVRSRAAVVVASVITGTVLTYLNLLLVEWLPRFALPLWILLSAAFVVAAAIAAEAMLAQIRRVRARHRPGAL
jgi:hypothetical protein